MLSITEFPATSRAEPPKWDSSFALLGPLSQCVCVYDEVGRCLFVNPALTHWLDREVSDLVGRSIHELWPMEVSIQEAADLRRVLEVGRIEREELRPGVHGMVQVQTVKYLAHLNGAKPTVVVVFEPLPSRTTSRRGGEFASWMSLGIVHDFNNALTLLRGQLESIEASLVDPSEGFANLSRLLDHAAQLPRQLLALARGSATGHHAIDLHALLLGLEDLLRPRAARVSIDYQLHPDEIWIEGDSVQITQAVMNLACNALEAMKGEGRLRFSTRCDESTIFLDVDDTGPGIPPELRERILEPGFTTRQHGNGLGLAMVAEIARRHGGKVSCAGGPNLQGARVTLELPRWMRTPSGTNRGRVLVIDPGDGLARLSAMILEQDGYQAMACRTLEQAGDQSANVIIVCATLLNHEPQQRSLEAWLEQNPTARLIVTSTGLEPKLTRSIASRGCVFLHKPFNAETLLRAVYQERGEAL